MGAPNRIKGVLSPVVTPFKPDLSPDKQRFIAHCKWLLSQNCGLAVFGTNSEVNSLATEECMTLLDELRAAGLDISRMMPDTGCCSITSAISVLQKTVCARRQTLIIDHHFARSTSDVHHRAHRAPFRHHRSVALVQDGGDGRIDLATSFC